MADPDPDDVEDGIPLQSHTTVPNHTEAGKVREGQGHTGGVQTGTDRDRQGRTQGEAGKDTGKDKVRDSQGESGEVREGQKQTKVILPDKRARTITGGEKLS